MSELTIEGLRVQVAGHVILDGIDLTVRSGEVHAVMGPNGSGKSTLSHVLMGKPGYDVVGGSVTIDRTELLGLVPWERAQAGLFLALQYPIEVPGVSITDVVIAALTAAASEPMPRTEAATRLRTEAATRLRTEAATRLRTEAATRLRAEAARVGFDERFLTHPLNVDLSGGERKRSETVQLAALTPRFAVLDEIDSGLDVDGLREVSRRVEQATTEFGLGVLAITHYRRLLRELRPDVVHVLVGGRLVASGGAELADELERTGYAAYGEEAAAGDARLGGGDGGNGAPSAISDL